MTLVVPKSSDINLWALAPEGFFHICPTTKPDRNSKANGPDDESLRFALLSVTLIEKYGTY
jgi:hypothetical protein